MESPNPCLSKSSLPNTWHKDGKSYQTTQTPTYKELINTEKTGTYTLMIQNSKCKDLTLESYAYKVKMYCNANLYQVGGNPLGGNPLQVFAENNTIFCANERIEAILNVRTPNNDLSEETTGRQSAFQWLKEGLPIHQANNQNFTATEIGNYASPKLIGFATYEYLLYITVII